MKGVFSGNSCYRSPTSHTTISYITFACVGYFLFNLNAQVSTGISGIKKQRAREQKKYIYIKLSKRNS